MPAKRVRDILDHARSLHHRLSERFEHLRTEEADERVVLLLKYLARPEENLNDSLAKYAEGAAKGVLETWQQFVPDETLD